MTISTTLKVHRMNFLWYLVELNCLQFSLLSKCFVSPVSLISASLERNTLQIFFKYGEYIVSRGYHSYYTSCAWVLQIRWPGVSEGESKTFHHVRLSRKRELKPLKIANFFHFWKIVQLNTDVLEPSLLSEIDNWSLLIKNEPKAKLIACTLKVGMQGKKTINHIYLKIDTQRFLGSLITDLHSDLKNSKW